MCTKIRYCIITAFEFCGYQISHNSLIGLNFNSKSILLGRGQNCFKGIKFLSFSLSFVTFGNCLHCIDITTAELPCRFHNTIDNSLLSEFMSIFDFANYSSINH